MNVYLAGSRAFGAAVYQALTDVEVAHVQTGPAGRVEFVGVCSPAWASREGERDRLRALAEDDGVPWLPAGELTWRTLPDDVDLIVAAHSHDFIGRRTRNRATHGAIGYHPSLLPLHRGRDAVRWTIRDRDRIAGGSVYWLNDRMDGGPIAAQDWCFVRPDDTPESLWRRELFPIGVRLLVDVVVSVMFGHAAAVPQDEALATFEPAMDPPRKFRPDLYELPPAGGWKGLTLDARPEALR